MNNDARWVALLAILGFLTAFVLWGRPRPAGDPEMHTLPAPAQTTGPEASAHPAPPIDYRNASPTLPPHGNTKLTFEPDSVDLGIIPMNEQRTAQVRVTNPTDKTIIIRDLGGSCGCLHVESASKEIPAHGALTLDLRFNGLSGRKSDVVRVNFKTDEATDPFVTVDVRAKVKEEILLDPRVVNFDFQKKNETRTRDVLVKSGDGKAFEIKSVIGTQPEFSYTWEPVAGKDKSEYTVHAVMKGDKGGMVNDTAAVMTDRPHNGTVPLTVSGTIEHDQTCKPSIMSASIDEQRMVGAFSTVMTRLTPGHLEIVNVADASKQPIPLDYVIDRLTDDSCRISIKFKGPFPQRAPFGSFSVKTNVEEREYFVPYRITGQFRMPRPANK